MQKNKRKAFTKYGAIFLLVYALISQKPNTGFNFQFKSSNLVSHQNDIALIEIYEKRHVAKAISTTTPLPTLTPQVASITISKSDTSKVQVIAVINKYAGQFNVDANIMIKIAECESGLNSKAINGQYAGIFQFHSNTWESNRRAMGVDTNTSLRFNANESAKTAAFKMSRDGFGAWPACSLKAIASK